MLNAEVLSTLLDPETKTTFIDSVIVALSDKDLPKLCAKVSEIEAPSVKLFPAPEVKTSVKVIPSAKVVINSMLGLSVIVEVSAKLVENVNTGALSPIPTMFPLFMFTSVRNSSEGLAVSSNA